MDLSLRLEQGLKALNIKASPGQQQQLLDYLSLLKKWNQAYNLTAITDLNQMLPLHLFDSVAINPFLHGTRHIDVGTGAGLPGIPLAILNPDQHFSLLDSNGKKTRFLLQAKLALGLNNLDIINLRAEQYHASPGFDSVISRAFASLNDMITWTQHLLNEQGRFIAMKGIYPEAELKNLPKLIQIEKIQSLKIPELEADRHVVVLFKYSF